MKLTRLSAGHYVTLDGRYAVDYVPGSGWIWRDTANSQTGGSYFRSTRHEALLDLTDYLVTR